MKTQLSVIVPVYNTERFLRRCIESILNQNVEKCELILINDGSTDSSGKICDEYAKENQIVISSEIYQQLIKIDSILASQFHKDEKNDFYITTQGYEHYSNNYRKHILKNSTKKKDYNGAWFNVL